MYRRREKQTPPLDKRLAEMARPANNVRRSSANFGKQR
jgi:hypothetical protein